MYMLFLYGLPENIAYDNFPFDRVDKLQQWRKEEGTDGKYISCSSQCSMTGVTKAVVLAILSVGWCI